MAKATQVDLSEFEEQARRQGPKCWRQIVELTPDQEEKLEAALATKRLTHAAISRTVTGWLRESATPIKVADGSVARHRAKECGCA